MKPMLLGILFALLLESLAWAQGVPPINVPPINQPPIGNPNGPPRR